MAESAFRGHLTLSVNVLTGQLRLRRRMQVDSPPLQVDVNTLGVEDVLLWANRAADSIVELVIRVRAAVFSGPWDAEDAADTRMMILVRMEEVVAHSFLFCLASNLVDDAAVAPDSSTVEARHRHSTLLCADLRKALMRRDLLNRGWTDEALCSEQRLWQLLTRAEAHSWDERHQHHVSCALAADAPQLRLHVRDNGAADNNQTPNPTALPPRPPTISMRSSGAAAAAAAAAATAAAAAHAPALPNGGSSWHVSRSALSQPTVALLTSPLFADGAVAARAPAAAEEVPAPEPAPVYKPKTAYQLYHKYTVAELKRQDPTIKHQQAFKKAGQMWSEMSLSEQAVWKSKADVVPKRKLKKAKLEPRIAFSSDDHNNNNEEEYM